MLTASPLRQALRQVPPTPRTRRRPLLPPLPHPAAATVLDLLQPNPPGPAVPLQRHPRAARWVLAHLAYPSGSSGSPSSSAPRRLTRFFAAITGFNHRALLMTAYAAGLRSPRSPPCGSTTSTANAWSSASARARAARIATSCSRPGCSTLLRDYWKAARPQDLAVPRPDPDRPISAGAVTKAAARPGGPPGLEKHVTVHALAAQLRHPPARGRHRPADHPGPARPRQPQAPPPSTPTSPPRRCGRRPAHWTGST